MADDTGRELNADDIWECFKQTYYVQVENRQFTLVDYDEGRTADGDRVFTGTILVDGEEQRVSGRGKGLISSVLATIRDAYGLDFEVVDYSEHALGTGVDARAAAYIEWALPDGRSGWGVGIDEDVAPASVRAIISAANGASHGPGTERF